MAYRRRRRGRSMYSRRRRYFGRGYSQTNTGKPFNTTGRRGHWKRLKIPGRIVLGNEEVKFFDNQLPDAIIPDPSLVTFSPLLGGVNLLTITQGVGASQRIGRKINLLQMVCTLMVNMPQYENATWSTIAARLVSNIRYFIVLDRQANGVGISTTTDFLSLASVFGFNNLYRKGRFKVLRDKRIQLKHAYFTYNGVASQWETDAVQRVYTFSINLNGLPIEYSSTTGAIAELMTNNIFILICDQNATASVNASHWQMNYRVRYIDA